MAGIDVAQLLRVVPDSGRLDGLSGERTPDVICITEPGRDLIAARVVFGRRLLAEQRSESGVAGDRTAVAAEQQIRDRRLNEQTLEQRERVGDLSEPGA